MRERGEGAFCQRYPLWNEHRCNISQDKGSSVGNVLLYSRDKEQGHAAVGRCKMLLKLWIIRSESSKSSPAG